MKSVMSSLLVVISSFTLVFLWFVFTDKNIVAGHLWLLFSTFLVVLWLAFGVTYYKLLAWQQDVETLDVLKAMVKYGSSWEELVNVIWPSYFETTLETDHQNQDIRRAAIPDFSITPQQAIDATGREQYVLDDIVQNMPKGVEGGAIVVFFNVGSKQSFEQIKSEFSKRQLIPCDPYTLCTINANDLSFADDYPNVTLFQDVDGRWCYISFGYANRERYVDVGYVGVPFNKWCWFAGLRRKSLT